MATTAPATIAPMTPPDNPALWLDAAPVGSVTVLGDAVLEGEDPMREVFDPETEVAGTPVEPGTGVDVILGVGIEPDDVLDWLWLEDFEESDEAPVLDWEEESSLNGSGGGVGIGGGLGMLNSRAQTTGVDRFIYILGQYMRYSFKFEEVRS